MLLGRTQSLPALKDTKLDVGSCALPGGFSDIISRSRLKSETLRDPHGDPCQYPTILGTFRGREPSPRIPKPRYSYQLVLDDPMHGFKIGDRVIVIGRAELKGADDGGTVLAAGRTSGVIVVEFDSFPGLPRDIKANCLHQLTAKEDEELEVKKLHSAYKKQERETRRLNRAIRRATVE